MIVDDEPDIVAIVELALRSGGYEVGGFTSPEEAIEEIRRNSNDYALVISDVRMPGVSGFELARRVREARPGMPLVLMTAFEINKSEFSMIFPSTCVSDLVKKPFSNAQLFDIVRRYIGLTEKH
jgi:two-component system, cell cycle sensor histidine kinase and response regulator CckA